MRIHLLYFASFRDAAGKGEEMRDLPEGTRVEICGPRSLARCRCLAAFPAMPPAAVNEEYVDAERGLSDGDEIAFLPPVAGG